MFERLRFYWFVMTQDMTASAIDHANRFRTLIDNLKIYVGDVKEKVILDVGCGRMYPYTILLHSLGNSVVGIDTVYVPNKEGFFKAALNSLLSDGLSGFGWVLMNMVLQKKSRFFKALQVSCNLPLNNEGVHIKKMSIESLMFESQTFDLVVSFAVFEHVRDVAKAVSEVERVLKSGGIAYVEIHLFTSRSGGHRWDWADPNKVPPWDHLRQRKRVVQVYLNKLRSTEYIEAFKQKFNILDVRDEVEQESQLLLTPEIRAELSQYHEDELFKKAIVIIAKKI